MKLQPVGRQSVADAVYVQLRDSIVSDAQPVGSNFPSERDLAARAGVNRQAVREAMQRLRALGLVDIVHGGGVRVRDWRRSADLSLLPEIVVDSDGHIRAEPALALVRFSHRSQLRTQPGWLRGRRPGGDERGRWTIAMGAMWALHEHGGEVATGDVITGYERVWSAIIAASGSVAYQLVSNSLRATAHAYAGLFPAKRVPNPVPTQRYQETVDAVKAGDAEGAAASARNTLAAAVKIFEIYTAPPAAAG